MDQRPRSRFSDLPILQPMAVGPLATHGKKLSSSGARFPWTLTSLSHIPHRSTTAMKQEIAARQVARYSADICGAFDLPYLCVGTSMKGEGWRGCCGTFLRPMSSTRKSILSTGSIRVMARRSNVESTSRRGQLCHWITATEPPQSALAIHSRQQQISPTREHSAVSYAGLPKVDLWKFVFLAEHRC